MLEACSINLVGTLVGLSLESLKEPPGSTFFILILSVGINFLMGFVNTRIINLKEYKEVTIKSTLARRELMKAMQSGNKRQVARLQKEQQEIMRDQSRMSMQQMKSNLLFFIPLFLFWWILGVFYANTGPVALMPFNAPLVGTKLSHINWYVFCSLTAGILTRRVLGLTFEIP